MKPKQHIKTTAKRIGSFERRIGKIPEGNTYITNPYGGYTSLSHKIDQELSIQGSSPVNINNNISNIQNSANSYNVNINKVTKQITQLETDLKKWEQDLAKELKKKDSSGEKIVHLASSRKLFSRLNNTDINHRISTDSHNINGISSSYSDMLSSTTMHINNLLSTKRTKSSIGKTYDTQISYIDRTTRSGLLYGNTQKNSEYLKEFYLSMDSKKWHEYKSLLHRLIGDVTTKELLEKDMAKSCLVLAKHYKELENRSYDQIKEYIKLQIQNDYEKSKIDREITKISDFNYHFSKYISKEQTTNEYTTRTLENLKADHQKEIINTVNDEMQKNLEKTTKSAEIISDMRLQQIEDRLKTDISKYIDIEISALTKSGSMASSIESSIDYNSEVVEKTIYNDKLVNSENFRSFITELIKKEINHGIKYQSTNDVSNLVDLISTEILNKYIKHEFLVTAGAVIKSRVNNNALLESYIEKHIQDNSVVSKSLTQYLINSDPEVQKNFMKYVYDAVYNNVRGIDISNQTNTSINSSDKSINMDLSNESKNNSDIEVSISEQSSNESNTQFSSGNNSISSINSRIANILSNIRTSSNSNEVANNVSGSRVNSNISVNSESEYSNDSITLDELEIYDILNSFIFDENEEVFTKVISSIDNHIIKEELYKSITNMIEETIDVETGKIDSEYVQIAIDYGLSDVLNVFAKKSNTNSVIESVFNIYSEMDNYLSNSYESLNAKQELQSNKNQYNSNSLRKQSIENTYISDSVGNASRTNIANSANVEKSLNIANESNITNDIEDIVESVQFEEIIDSIEFGDQIDYNELEDILSIIKSYATHNKRISGSQVFSARSLSVFNPTHNTTSTYMGEFSPISYYRGTLSYGLSNSSSFETDLNTNIYDMIQKRLDLMSNSLIHNFEFAGDRLNLINTGLFNSSKSINNSYSTIFNMVENTIGKHILSHSKKLSTSINKRYIKVIDNLNARGQLDQQFINSVTTLNNYTTDSMLQSILNGDKSINSNILNSITNRIAKQNIVDKTLSNNLISNNFKSDNWISNSMLSNSFVSYNLLSNTNLLDKFINTTVNIKNSSINKLESSDLGSRSYFDNNNFNNNSYNNINNNNNIGNNWYNSNNSNSNTYNNLNSISSSDITNLSQNNLTTLLRTYFNYSSIVNNSEMMKNKIYNSSFVNSVLGNKSNILKTNSIFYSFARNLYDVDFSKDTTNELYQIERVDNLTKTLNKISQTMREGNEEIKSYKIIPYKRAEMILKTLTDLKQIEQTMVQNAVDSLSSVGNNITINSPNLRNNYMMNLSNVFSYLTNYTNSQTDERVTNYNKVLRNINNLFNSKSSLNNIEKLISRSNSLNKSSNFNNLNNSNNSNNLSITSISNKLSRLNSLNHTSNMQNLNSLTNLGNLSNLSNMTSLSNSSTLSQLTGLFNLSNAISSDNISNSTGFIINPKFTGLMQKLSSSLKVNLMSVSPNLLTPISVGLNIKDSSISLSSSRPIFLNTEQGMTFITENNLYQASKLFNKQVSDVLSSAVSSKFMDAKKAVFTELNISENNYRNFDSYINYIVDNSKSFEEVSLRYEEKSEENSGELIKKIQKQNEIITELREEISVIKDTEHNVKINIDRLSEDIMRQLIDKTKKERQRRGGF